MRYIRGHIMDSKKIVDYIESSFLQELLTDENVTDISYNGSSIYYLHNLEGRKLSDIQVSGGDAKDFVRQVANITEKQFSYQSPIVDVTAGKYRLNAVHNSIGRYKEEQSITFSLRIASSKPRINDRSGFLTKELISLLKAIISCKIPIVIGGITGSGKTEFQKYLFTKMEPATRLVVIDNVLELSQTESTENLDMNIWQAEDKNISMSIQMLVKNALRSNPDWLIIAESRGGEMLEILNSVMTGHPIITTIHAQGIENMPNRIARMVMMNDKRSDYQEVLQDIYDNFPIHIYLKRKINKQKRVYRYIDSIAIFDKKGKVHKIYEHLENGHIYRHIPKGFLSLFEEVDDDVFISTFGGGANETL